MLIDSMIAYFFLNDWLSSSNMLTYVLGLVVYAIFVAIVISVFAYLFGWAERKIIAKVQHRHGPTYVGKYGILQNLADLVKLLSKQQLVPDNADKPVLYLAVMLILAISTFIILLLPFSPSLQATDIGVGLLAIFIIIAFFPILIFLTGFSSGNKFADISAQRSVLILIAYEIPMMVVLASIALMVGSYNIQAVINAQSGNHYLAIFMPIGLVVFFIVMLAELERPPFDLKEADSELIAGWLTDISAPFYAIALFIDYTRMFMGSLLIAILFFGGWSGSLLPPSLWLIIKAVVISLFIVVVRATTVRMRIDRILRTGWWYLMPLSLINLLLVYILFIR